MIQFPLNSGITELKCLLDFLFLPDWQRRRPACCWLLDAVSFPSPEDQGRPWPPSPPLLILCCFSTQLSPLPTKSFLLGRFHHFPRWQKADLLVGQDTKGSPYVGGTAEWLAVAILGPADTFLEATGMPQNRLRPEEWTGAQVDFLQSGTPV